MRRVNGFKEAEKLLNRRIAGTEYSLSPRLKQSLGDMFGVHTAEEAVQIIINDVRAMGDKAILELAKKIDNIEQKELCVKDSKVKEAVLKTDPEIYSALQKAAERIKEFHDIQRAAIPDTIEINGCYQLAMPLSRVGVYAPGGTASYPSSVLMTAIPARCAGVQEIILATPPGKDGHIPAITLAAAEIAGVDKIFAVGGAQAIAALAYGTETVPAVDKICGPGNIFVMLAKKEVFGTVDIDGLQGPSEVLIIACDKSNPEFIADEILAQAEHDALAQSILVTISQRLADGVEMLVREKLAKSARSEILAHSVQNTSLIATVDTFEEAVKLANLYAPEHLVVDVREVDLSMHEFTSAGCIFTGSQPTVPMGDYISGPSHALPTGGTARFTSPLNVSTFIRYCNVVNVDDDALRELGPAAIVLARAEGLMAHAQAIENRLKNIGGS
jgi:histidinol dehydrogenase